MIDEQKRELRLHVMLTVQEMEAVEQFRAKRKFSTQKEAVRELLRLGMNVAEKQSADHDPKKA
jgi:hypothetical protein